MRQHRSLGDLQAVPPRCYRRVEGVGGAREDVLKVLKDVPGGVSENREVSQAIQKISVWGNPCTTQKED